MPIIVPYELEGAGGTAERGYRFWCPACACGHMFCTHPAVPFTSLGKPSPRWTFDGNTEQPTFVPSLHYQHHAGNWGDTDHDGNVTWHPTGAPITDCHLTVTRGRITYLTDCPHEMRGETIDMVEYPENADDRDRLKHMPHWLFRDADKQRK